MLKLSGAEGLRSTGVLRVMLGVAQGLALYLLFAAHDDRVWPATSGYNFAPLLMVALFVPLLVTQAIGNMRARTLVLWASAATAVLAALAVYDIWRSWPLEWIWVDSVGEQRQGRWNPVLLPSIPFVLAAIIAVFITHALVSAGDADRRIIARYETYFETAWKLALQLVLWIGFVGVFWGVLFLGANLFKLINIETLSDTIEKPWFAIPVTTLATVLALHVTDVRSSIVRGMRSLVHVLLSWLLPLLALLVAAFLIALVFTGVQPLWGTRFAYSLLLLSAAALLILINAAYQDGDAAEPRPAVLRFAGSAAALCLLPLAALSLLAIGLRVQQYGWTNDRIFASAIACVALVYSGGYAASVAFRGPWLKLIERWNVATAFFVVAMILALFSPVLDPARISVASQVARLESGRVTHQVFDFGYLRWEGGRYGQQALLRLENAARTAGRPQDIPAIAQVLAEKTRSEAQTRPMHVSTMDRAANLKIYPSGQPLPAGFVQQDWTNGGGVPTCLWVRERSCDAFPIDLNGDGEAEVIIVDEGKRTVLARGGDSRWALAGTLGGDTSCFDFVDAMRQQEFRVIAPLRPWNEVEARGRRFGVIPQPPALTGCAGR
jgi:hypothetical protein